MPIGRTESSLGLLAEFAAFDIVDFQTFNTEIFAELNVYQAAAAALALLLVALGTVVLRASGPVPTWPAPPG